MAYRSTQARVNFNMANIYVGKGTSTEDIYCGGADADGGTAGGASATDASRVSQQPDLRMLLHVNLDSLATRREDLSRRSFRDIMDPASCLHSLLPPPRSTAITSRLRSSQILSRVHTRTKRYCSFIYIPVNLLSTMTSIRLFVLGACLCTMLASSFFLQSCFVFLCFFVFLKCFL